MPLSLLFLFLYAVTDLMRPELFLITAKKSLINIHGRLWPSTTLCEMSPMFDSHTMLSARYTKNEDKILVYSRILTYSGLLLLFSRNMYDFLRDSMNWRNLSILRLDDTLRLTF